MRWVFYGLLIFNLIFFAWQQLGNSGDHALEAVGEPAEGVMTISLLSEAGEAADIELRDDAKRCDVYGPFYSDLDGRSFLRAAKAEGLLGSQVEELVELKPYYRLYVPSRGSRKQTQALINRLRGYKLNAELITEGNLKRSINLGDFESVDEIKRLEQKLSIHDISVEVLEKSRDYKQYWVYLNPGSADKITGSLQSRLIEKYSDIFHQEKYCKPVASSE